MERSDIEYGTIVSLEVIARQDSEPIQGAVVDIYTKTPDSEFTFLLTTALTDVNGIVIQTVTVDATWFTDTSCTLMAVYADTESNTQIIYMKGSEPVLKNSLLPVQLIGWAMVCIGLYFYATQKKGTK